MNNWRVRFGALVLGCAMCLGTSKSAVAARQSVSKRQTAPAKTVGGRSKAGSAAKARTGAKVSKTASIGRATQGRRSAVLVRGRHGRAAVPVLAVRRTRYVERFTGNSFADNLTAGDVTGGEDPVVRAAAIEALGNMNGTALAIDPSSGRILAMVNQKLALSPGAEPCSTIKLSVALAALEEGIVRKDTPVTLSKGYRVNLTEALAHSNNLYFETLGRSMGFETVKHYAKLFGLGELAGYQIKGEQLGTYPDEELPKSLGGVGKMCSFGESVSMTPLQLGAMVSAIANGGTLYYLQHPETQDDLTIFEPKVKRILDIGPLIPEMKPGMEAVVNYGTARSLKSNFREFPVMGKTGTCSSNGVRFGWFGSYAETPTGRIVTVIFLEGGRPTFGPKAAELTGQFYRSMAARNYFTPKAPTALDTMTAGTR